MAASVRISRKAATALRDFVLRAREAGVPIAPTEAFAAALLSQEIVPRKSKPMRTERLKVRRSKKATKREETSAIYREVGKRANGICEACGWLFLLGDPPELDHQAGRGRSKQTVENTWLIHGRTCHRAKTNSSGGARIHLERFIAHAEKHGYHAEAERARARLEGIVAVREREATR